MSAHDLPSIAARQALWAATWAALLSPPPQPPAPPDKAVTAGTNPAAKVAVLQRCGCVQGGMHPLPPSCDSANQDSAA